MRNTNAVERKQSTHVDAVALRRFSRLLGLSMAALLVVSSGCRHQGDAPDRRAAVSESAIEEQKKAEAAAREEDAAPEGAMRFTATAYTIEGKTASGLHTRKGIAAADPDVLPLGTRVRVSGAGKHSGEYLIADTGRKIQGRTIDIWMEDTSEALRFGRRPVQVEIIRLAKKDER